MRPVTRQLIISNTVFSGLAGLTVQVINLFVLPLFIRNLGPELYGVWVISGIILGYLGLMDFGFGQGITRYAADAYQKKDYERLSSVVMSGLVFLTFLGLVVGTMVIWGRYAIVDFFSVSEENRQTAANLLFVTGIFSLVGWPQRITGIVLQAVLRIKEQQILKIVTTTLSSCLMLTLVYLSYDIVLIKVLLSFLGLALWIPSWYMVRKYVPGMKWARSHISLQRLKEMSPFSIGMFFASLLSMLAIQLDSMLIGKMLSLGAIAYYVVASKFFSITNHYTRMLGTTLLPTVFNLNATNDKGRISKLVNDMIKYRSLLNIPTAFLCLAICRPFIRLWMGPEYESCAIWAQVYLLVPIMVPFGIVATVVKGTGRIGLVNTCDTIRVLINLSVSIILIPYWGIGGPIVGTVTAMIVFGDPQLFPWFCRVLGIRWQESAAVYAKILMTNIPILCVSYGFIKYLAPETWLSLITASFVVFVTYVGVNFFVFVGKKEKGDVYSGLESMGLLRLFNRDKNACLTGRKRTP